MILIGCEGKHWDDTVPPPPDLIGVMGPGKRYSVAMVICPACKQGTVVALWQRVCRACGKTHIDGMDAWMKTAHASALGPFRKVARPRPPKV